MADNYYLEHTGAELDEAIRKVLSGELDVPLQEKTISPSTSEQVIVPDSNYKGLSQVTVRAMSLQTKTVTPTTSQQTILADSSYNGLSKVTVSAIPQSYTDEVYNQGYEEGYNAVKPYQMELSYLESTGTQYINTEILPNQNTRVVCEFQFTTTSSAFQSVFGSRGAASGYAGRFCFHLTSAAVFRSDYNTANLTFSSSLGATDRHTVDQNQNTCTVDSTSVTHSTGSFAGVYPMYLFALNTAGTTECKTNLRIYSCQIYNGSTLLRDLIPVLDLDGTPCLYDKVKRRHFYNVGTGSFTYA